MSGKGRRGKYYEEEKTEKEEKEKENTGIRQGKNEKKKEW